MMLYYIKDDIKMEMELNNVDERYAPPEYELLNELGFSYLLDNFEDEDNPNIEFNIDNSFQSNDEDMKDVSMEICSYDSNNEDNNTNNNNDHNNNDGHDHSIIKDNQESSTIFDKSPLNTNYFLSKDYKFPDPDVTPTLNMMKNRMSSLEKSSTNPFGSNNDFNIYTPIQNVNNSSILSDSSSTPTISVNAYKLQQQKQQQHGQSTELLNQYSILPKDILSASSPSSSSSSKIDVEESSKGNNLMNRFNRADSSEEGIIHVPFNGRYGASTSFIGKDISFREESSIDDIESPLFQKHFLDMETPSKQKIINLSFSSVSPNPSTINNKGESSSAATASATKTPIPQQFLERLADTKAKYSTPSDSMLTKDKEKGTYIFNHNYLKEYYSFLKKNNNSVGNSSNNKDFPFSSPDASSDQDMSIVNETGNSSVFLKSSSPLKSEIKPFPLSKEDSLSDILLSSPTNQHQTIKEIVNRHRSPLPDDDNINVK